MNYLHITVSLASQNTAKEQHKKTSSFFWKLSLTGFLHTLFDFLAHIKLCIRNFQASLKPFAYNISLLFPMVIILKAYQQLLFSLPSVVYKSSKSLDHVTDTGRHITLKIHINVHKRTVKRNLIYIKFDKRNGESTLVEVGLCRQLLW